MAIEMGKRMRIKMYIAVDFLLPSKTKPKIAVCLILSTVELEIESIYCMIGFSSQSLFIF
jgi:hypothetical protein